MNEEFLTVQEVADLLKVPKATLYAWRSRGQGPRVAKLGKHLRYRRSDIDAWVDSLADDAGPTEGDEG